MQSPELPRHIESERALLGGMMLNPTAIDVAMQILGETAEPFFLAEHGILYETMIGLYRTGKPVDLVTVSAALSEKDMKRVGAVYIAELTDAVPTSANADYYAGIVLDTWTRRRLIKACQRAVGDLYATNVPLGDIRDTLEVQVFKTAHSGPASKPEFIGALAVEEKKRLESVQRGETILGLRTGFKVLDDIMMPMRPADYIILAACTSVGKTTLACNIVNNVAKAGAGVLFFSMEMTKQAITNKLMGIEAGVDLVQSERTGYMSDFDRRNLDTAMKKIQDLNILIDDESGMTPTKLRTKARAAMAQNEIGLIVIDYLGRLSVKGLEHDLVASTTVISGEIKDMAKELNIPVLVLCQLNRKGAEEKPRLSHLRQSGSLEQDADIAILLSRCSNPQYVTAQVAKQRIGPTGETQMFFEKETQRFLDIDHRGDPVYPAEYQAELEEELY